MAETNIKISLEIADKAAGKALGGLISGAESADKSFGKLKSAGVNTFNEIAVSIGKSSGIFDIFAGNLAANLVTAALSQMASAASALFQTFVVDGVTAAAEAEAGLNRLATALAVSGEYSEEALASMQEFASGIQETTKVDDDAVLSQLALAKAFGATNEQAKLVVQAALELSAATGKDLDSSTEQVAKTLGGMAGQLGKINPEIRELTKEQLKAGEAARILISQYNGSASGQVTTFAGAVAQSKNSFGDLQEAVGNLIVQNPVFVAAISEVGKILNELASSVENNKSVLFALSEALILAIDTATFFVAVIDTIGRSFTVLYNIIALFSNQVGQLLTAPFTAFSQAAQDAFDVFSSGAEESASNAYNAFSETTALEEVGVALQRIGQASEEGLAKLRDGASTSVAPVNSAKVAVDELNESLKTQADLGASLAEQLVSSSQSTQDKYNLELEMLQARRDAELISDVEFAAQKQELAVQQYVADEQLLAEALTAKKITEQQYFIARDQMAKEFAAAQAKRDVDAMKKDAENKKKLAKQEQDYNESKIRATADVFGALADVAALGGKKNFEIVRAFNLAEAITAGILSIQKAAASAPPPFNVPAIVSASVLSAANVAKIVATKAPGYEDGGIIPGSSFSGDRVSARVNSGEMILNRNQQAKLFSMANGAGGGDVVGKLDMLIGLLAGRDERVVVNIGGQTVVDTLRSELASGRTFA